MAKKKKQTVIKFPKKSTIPQVKRGRPTNINKKLDQLKKLEIFRLSDAKKNGISYPTLFRLVANEKIISLGAGFYLHPESGIPPEERDYSIACAKFGKDSAIGGMTALFYYNLIEQIPNQIWVIVYSSKKTTNPLYKLLRTKTDPTIGVEKHKTFKITNLERTIVEAFRYSTKIGLRIALYAARKALIEKRTSIKKIHQQAESLGLTNFIDKHWESIIPESQVTA